VTQVFLSLSEYEMPVKNQRVSRFHLKKCLFQFVPS